MPITSLIMVRFSIHLHRWNCLSLLYSLHTLVLLYVKHVEQNNENNSIINTKLLNVCQICQTKGFD